MSDQIENIEIRSQQAVNAYSQSDKPNLAKLAREFGIPRSRLRSRVAGHQPHTTRTQPNKALNPIQDKALVSWIQTLRHAHTLNTPELIERSANQLLKDAGSDRQVGHNWVYRFIKRLPPDIPFISLKPAEKARFESENYRHLNLWFNQLKKLIDQYKFIPNEIFNWDETGYQIGQGKRQKLFLGFIVISKNQSIRMSILPHIFVNIPPHLKCICEPLD